MARMELEKGVAIVHRRLPIGVVLLCILFVESLAGEEKPKRTSWFDQEWLKTLVSIEVAEPNKDPEKEPKLVPIGSGFVVATPGKHMALVTAKHVVFDENKGWTLRPHLAYRLNRKEGASDVFTEALVAKYSPEGWFKSAKHDVACRLIIGRTKGSDVVAVEYSHFLTADKLQAGAPLFIIGFPMGLRSEQYAVPIVRYGIVARTEPNSILADAFVFPGNSGGPVVYVPAIRVGSLFTSPILQDSRVLGLVSDYIPYVDVAISPQTRHPRITFEENSGLCHVIPASAVLELLQSPGFVAADTREGDGQAKQPKERMEESPGRSK